MYEASVSLACDGPIVDEDFRCGHLGIRIRAEGAPAVLALVDNFAAQHHVNDAVAV